MRAIATILLGLALLAWSVVSIAIDSRGGLYRAIAERLESGAGDGRDMSYFARIEEVLTDSEISPLCVREIVRSTTSITLAILDASYRSGDPMVRSAALAKARDKLSNGLRCFPRDGNLWLRLAMVEYALGGATDPVQQMLRASAATAPSEAWILIPRISFTARLLGSELPDLEETLRTDVRNLVGHAHLHDIVELYLNGGESLRIVLESAFHALGADRRAAIESAIASKAGN